jgi:hypothetical protein
MRSNGSTIEAENFMRLTAVTAAVAIAVLAAPLIAQETKPVPKDSVRVSIPGCSKGYVFTTAPRTVEAPGSVDVPVGMHLRMNGPKKMITDIKAHEGSLIEITGLMKKGQYGPSGIGIGGVRVTPGQTPQSGTLSMGAPATQNVIDLEGWRPVAGECSTR